MDPFTGQKQHMSMEDIQEIKENFEVVDINGSSQEMEITKRKEVITNPAAVSDPEREKPNINRAGTPAVAAEAAVGPLKVPSFHPGLDESYAAKTPYPPGHSLMNQRLLSLMPSGHANVDALFAKPRPLPSGHPPLNSFIQGRNADTGTTSTAGDVVADPAGPGSVPYWHPSIDAAYTRGIKIPTRHMLFQAQFINIMPPGHPNIDLLMRDPANNPLPAGHPQINSYVTVRSELRAGHFLAVYLAALLILAVTWRMAYKFTKFVRGDSRVGKEGRLFELSDSEANQFREYGSGQFENYNYGQKRAEATMSRNFMLQDSIRKNAKHKSAPLYEYSDNLLSPPIHATIGKVVSETMKEKKGTILKTTWNNISSWRIPRTDWSFGTALFLSVYILLNFFSVISVDSFTNKSITLTGLSNMADLKLHFGSLTAANAMILIIPATRNSVLTWFLGLPFDHVVVFHRWIARWTVTCSLIHFLFYLKPLLTRYQEFVFWTGSIAFASGIIITITSIDYMRRRKFNIFFFSHFFFVGFFVFGFLHLRESRLFLAIGAAFYILDRILRALWTFVPRKTLVFENKGKDVAHVRFPKNPLTELLGQHKVGQYYFVNFPRLSLSEWHPFSVSSGPREKDIELHIRGLGDHTKEIVEHATECKYENIQTWIRFDGPYGVHDFNYRRYPVLLLAGGGIGITPIMGMLKDIYNIGNYSEYEIKKVKPHRMAGVYVIWTMSTAADVAAFMESLDECVQRSKLAQFPPLVLKMYITREKGGLPPPLIAGRPNFPGIFNTIMENHQNKAMLAFACGPAKMVAELWDECRKNTTIDRRIDFHHETFEF